MPLVTLCLRLHHPFRLSPDATTFLWDEKNREIFAQRAERCYVPALRLFADLVKTYPDFRVAYATSGTFLEQAEQYQPDVLEALRTLLASAGHERQVELLEQTYYHSYVSGFADPRKTEFKTQVSLHRQKLHELFGVRPTTFADTDLLYDNGVANIVADMGFKAILCEPTDRMLDVRRRAPIAADTVFRACGRKGRPRKLAVLPRNPQLSGALTSRSAESPMTAGEFAESLSRVGGEVVVLVCNFPLAREGTAACHEMFDFWKALPEEFARRVDIVPANPTEVAEWFQITDCPMVNCVGPTALADTQEADQPGLLVSQGQKMLFRALENLEKEAARAGGDLLRRFRYLTTSDHLLTLATNQRSTNLASELPDPYDSVATATYVLTRAVHELSDEIANFHILKRSAQTGIILVTPETGRLPSEGMGQFAKYVSGKSGGLGEVISALCKGLSERRIPVHLITINLSRRFREEAGLSEAEWSQKRHHLNPENVHLVSSSIFEGYRSAYDGAPLANAAEFQKQIINTYIKEIRSRYEGRAILHTNDWMAGGAAVAYARLRGMPVLHTVHNTHTGHIPLDMFYGVNLHKIWNALYMSPAPYHGRMDSQATAIKNATKISYVGEKFLKEVVEDYFLDRRIIPWSVRAETKAKYHSQSALVIPNAISPDVYPENQVENPELDKTGLARRYGLDDNVIEAKKLNLMKFQRRMGLRVDSEAILLFWPSRLDPVQKGIDLLEEIAHPFIAQHPDVQMAVIGDPVGGNHVHAEIMGRLAYTSGGRMAYRRFDQDLSTLGYAAASDVFGASLYEPFGQIDVVGNLYGATATNRDTGGYSDKIVPLNLRAWGAPIDSGNGVLFRDYNASGLWWGLSAAVQNHRYFRQHPKEWEKQAKRIMKDTRNNWNLDNMVARYIAAYEVLNDKRPLV